MIPLNIYKLEKDFVGFETEDSNSNKIMCSLLMAVHYFVVGLWYTIKMSVEIYIRKL